MHIDHRPYQCSGEDGCGFANWWEILSLSWRLCYIDDTHYVSKLGFFTKDCLKAHCARTEVTCDRWYAHYIYIFIDDFGTERSCPVERLSRIRTLLVIKIRASVVGSLVPPLHPRNHHN